VLPLPSPFFSVCSSAAVGARSWTHTGRKVIHCTVFGSEKGL
jgi:hypothetical protein